MRTGRAGDREVYRALGKVQKRLNRYPFTCLYPGCGRHAITSHSQQKERQLRAIAENGRVVAMNRNLFQAFKTHVGGPLAPMKEVGIGEASTFAGFCQVHDQSLFADIEHGRSFPMTHDCACFSC